MNFLGMGPGELMVIMVLALIVFGPQKLPEIGRNVGKAIGEFRRATTSITEEINRELSLDTPPPTREKRAEAAVVRETSSETVPAAAETPKPPLMLEIKPSARAAADSSVSNGVDVVAPPEEVVLESPAAYAPVAETHVETTVVGSSVETPVAGTAGETTVAPSLEPESEAAATDSGVPKPETA